MGNYFKPIDEAIKTSLFQRYLIPLNLKKNPHYTPYQYVTETSNSIRNLKVY